MDASLPAVSVMPLYQASRCVATITKSGDLPGTSATTTGAVAQPCVTFVFRRTFGDAVSAAFSRSPSDFLMPMIGMRGIRDALSVVGEPQIVVAIISWTISPSSI